MSNLEVSRRDAARAMAGALAGGALALGTPMDALAAAADESPAVEGIIDAHLHIVSAKLPGIRDESVQLAPFDTARDPDGPQRLARALQNEMNAAGVGHSLCMPAGDVSDEDPLGIADVLAQAALVSGPKLHAIGLIHPERFDRRHLARVEQALEKGRVKALKAYLGYFPYEPYAPGYRPYYKLASKYQVPVILHTGDTWSRTAKVKFAHPLRIDEIAVDFPNAKFVLAHFGNPWVMDAGEVIFKNENVWADVSAILVGDAGAFTRMESEGVIAREVSRVRHGIDFTGAPEKFLYGSDWPLSPMKVYRDFVRQLFPEKHHQAVFRDNAKALFKL